MPQKTMEQSVEEIDKKMSMAERESLRREIDMGEASQSAAAGLKSIEMDPRVKKELLRKKMLLAKDDNLAAISDRRGSIEAEQEKLREVIKKSIPKKSEMWPGKDQTDKNRALRHNLEFQAKYQDNRTYVTPEGRRTSVVQRWQENERRLHPDNPFAGNLDELRGD